MRRSERGHGAPYFLRRAVLAMLIVASTAVADVPLKSHNVFVVIPYRPGGGFDLTVRAFAPYFARELGENIKVLPENIPGAGGRLGATTVYRAEPDGLTLGIFNLPGFVLPDIMGEEVAYDLRKLSWIGRLEAQQYLLLVSAESNIHSIEDLQTQDEILFLSTGYGSTALAACQIAANQLGLMEKDPIFLAGYSGTADYLVGLIRGDGNVALAPVSSASKYLASGDLRALAVTAPTDLVEGIPTFAELGYPKLALLDLQRSIAGPPGMDGDLLAAIRDAFSRAISNPEFREVAERARLELSPLDGRATAEAVEENFRFYRQFKANLANPNTF